MSADELTSLEQHACPGAGSRDGMYIANTMAAISEALGMAPLGSASPPAEDEKRIDVAQRAGELAVEAIKAQRPKTVASKYNRP